MNRIAPNLASIIPDPKHRRIVYAIFAVVVLVAYAAERWFLSTEGESPRWLIGILDVLTFLAVPIAGLALANAPDTKVASVTLTPGDDVDIQAEVATGEAKGEASVRERDLRLYNNDDDAPGSVPGKYL